jgi:hypothetical protein
VTNDEVCYILGSSDTLLELTGAERELLNASPYTLAMNKFYLFRDKVGIEPTDLVLLDFHYPTHRVVDALLESMAGVAEPPTCYLDRYYERLLYKPYLHPHFNLNQRLHLLRHHGYIPSLFKRQPANLRFVNHLFAWYGDFRWANSLEDPLYWLHGSLVCAINLAYLIYPVRHISLVGVELNRSGHFFDEELALRPDLQDRHYRSKWEQSLHVTATAEKDGKTLLDGIGWECEELRQRGVTLSSASGRSLLVEKGVLDYRPLLVEAS